MGLSLDLRHRAVSTYEASDGTLDTVAKQFQIGTATLKRWLRRFKDTGNIIEKPHGGGTPAKIPSYELAKLAKVVAQKPDSTITEFRKAWFEETGVHASHATMVRALQRADLTLKKRRSGLLREIQTNTKQGSNSSNLR